MITDRGRKFLSDLKLHSDYLKWRPDSNGGKYESWEEACDDVMATHQEKYGKAKLFPIQKDIEEALDLYKDKIILASQRNLQYRGEQILKHEPRIYNCATMYANAPDLFEKAFYILLCGTGLGVHLGTPYIKHMPNIQKRGTGTETYIVDDSIEGWAKALGILISSFMTWENAPYPEYSGKNIRFDYSEIRPKGSHISGGFKAPGPEGLKQSLENIEKLLCDNPGEFKSIIIYDVLMHSSDAVLSGGVRRSAMNVMFFEDDTEMINAKIGNWREENKQRERSNNSVVLFRKDVTEEKLEELISLNQGMSDLGFVFVDDRDQLFNPCYEISFCFWDQWEDKTKCCAQFCNLNEINAAALLDEKGNLDEELYYKACRAASVIGTLQAGYTNFPHINKETEKIVAGEALLGVSITGWMANPQLLNSPDVLRKGAEIVKETNKRIAGVLGINQAARTTCVKPSGNSSVVLGCPSGIHPEHSKNYFRVMQLNKDSDSAQYLSAHMPELLEDSVWSNTNSDYAVYVPIINNENVIVKDQMKGKTHLEFVKIVQDNWVRQGKNDGLGYSDHSQHNVSVTIILDDVEEVTDYIIDNLEYFYAISFISEFGDKDYPQAPNTAVLMADEILEKYGNGSIFASGLIVDGLHYFDGDLWKACDQLKESRSIQLTGPRSQVLLKRDWIRRARKFATNYFQDDLEKMIYCLKDVHLFHKWSTINRKFKPVNFNEVLKKPVFRDVSDYASKACAGKSCELTF